MKDSPYPMILPVVRDQSCSEGTSRVHGASSVRNNTEMAESDCQTDCQGSNEARVRFVLIGDTEHDQHEDEAEEKFKSKSLELTDVGIQ